MYQRRGVSVSVRRNGRCQRMELQANYRDHGSYQIIERLFNGS